MRYLLDALGDDAGLVIIDARGVMAQLAEARAVDVAQAADREAAEADARIEMTAIGAELVRRSTLQHEFEADWLSEDMEQIGQDGTPYRAYGKRHRGSGEWVGFWPWCAMRDTWVQAGLDAFAAAPAPSP